MSVERLQAPSQVIRSGRSHNKTTIVDDLKILQICQLLSASNRAIL
jgi:hypothetical protein